MASERIERRTRGRLIHSDPSRTVACPNCDAGGKVRERTGSNVQINPTDPYYCSECRVTFEDYCVRDVKSGSGAVTNSPLVNALINPDADAVLEVSD